MKTLLRAALALLLASCTLTSALEAQTDESTSESTSEKTVQSSEDALEQAIADVRAGRPEQAIARLERMASRAEAAPRVLAILGALYIDAGREQEALETLEPLTRSGAPDPAVLYNAGRAAAALDQPERAKDYLRRSLVIEPQSPASRMLGFLSLRRGDCEDAYRWLRRWLSLDPSDTETRQAVAHCAIELRRTVEARSLVDSLDESRPEAKLLDAATLLLEGDGWGSLALLNELKDAVEPHLLPAVQKGLAKAYLQIGQADEAAELLSAIESPDLGTLRVFGSALHQAGESERALEVLQSPAQLALAAAAPDSTGPSILAQQVEILLAYGTLLADLGRHGEALPSLKAVTRQQPWRGEAWATLSRSLAEIGQEDAARTAERLANGLRQTGEALRVQGRGDSARLDGTGEQLLRALALVERGEREEALEVVEHQRELAPPEDLRPGFVHVRVLMLLDRNQEALGVAAQQVEDAPFSADVYYQRGIVQMVIGDLEAAEDDYRRALELAPEHVAALNDLAVLLMQREENGEAEALLQRVLEIKPDDPVARRNLNELKGD